MRWIDKLERRHGDLAIPNLINIVLIGQLVVWFVVMFISTFPLEFFPLIRSGLLHGQVWRAVTFIFVPTLTTSPLALLLELYFYWWIGNALTRAWGDFRFTVYWVTGMIGAVLSCLVTGAAGTAGLFYSLFFAYAWLWPEQRILLFFILDIDCIPLIALHTRARRDQLTDNDIFLQAKQFIYFAFNRRIGQYPGCLLEGSR